MNLEEYDELTGRIIGCAIEVHRHLGPGLLESAYRTCLAYELSAASLTVAAEVPLPVTYKGNQLDCGYRIDLLIENSVILELKAVGKVLPLHQAQLHETRQHRDRPADQLPCSEIDQRNQTHETIAVFLCALCALCGSIFSGHDY